MATTMGQPVTRSNKGLYWTLAIALLVLIAVVFSVNNRRTVNMYDPTGTTLPSTNSTVNGGATDSTIYNNDTRPTETGTGTVDSNRR